MDTLRGERVRVRPFRDEDVDRLHAYRDDPATARFQGWDVPYSRDEATSFVTWASASVLAVPGSWCQLAVQGADRDDLIGDVGIHTLMDEPTTVEVGVTFAPEARGRGLATEAVALVLDHLADRHGIVLARASVLIDNRASCALFERLGFARVCTRTADDGLDEHVYELALGDDGQAERSA